MLYDQNVIEYRVIRVSIGKLRFRSTNLSICKHERNINDKIIDVNMFLSRRRRHDIYYILSRCLLRNPLTIIKSWSSWSFPFISLIIILYSSIYVWYTYHNYLAPLQSGSSVKILWQSGAIKQKTKKTAHKTDCISQMIIRYIK